ncbi:39S ribosomal protein L48, mitochondrial isoform X1 [Hippoglossus hippoglossus]|uniref:39S ribosomal protein L48, mitochondrial isoform X1 n=1 Tax=Hippoglossus hippoglossus TaxID=8267 RepID=UPI00148E2CBD|nr:39S ribosomal protein L48, mitochondrial isoform X1 [Hippoglossus hippoglossus]
MNHVFRTLQASLARQVFLWNQTLPLCRNTPSIRHPVWSSASANEGRYHSMPTHGIGSWKYLLKKKAQKKKKDRHQMKQIVAATDSTYGTLNVKVSGYDMTLVERYTQYVHHLCNRLSIKVSLCYALPTKTTEVMLMQEHGTKMYVDAVLRTHERVVQLNSLNTTLCPVFMDVLLKHQPEGVQLSVNEHTEADFKARFKARPELQELMTHMNQ